MAELLDLDFPELIHPPAASYAATVALNYNLSWYDAEVGFERMQQFALDTYVEFGQGGGDQLVVAIDTKLDDVRAHTMSYAAAERFGIWVEQEQEAVARLAHRYLTGQGDDYEAFRSIPL
ncbi:MAG TPA: hypothetical protein VF401_02165 [Candidatus Saccharimonadales bacterium]